MSDNVSKSLRHNKYRKFVAKLQALAVHAKVSEHRIILSLVAKYEVEVTFSARFAMAISTTEVQDGYADFGGSKRFCCCLQYCTATSKACCFSTSEVSLTCSHAVNTEFGCRSLLMQR